MGRRGKGKQENGMGENGLLLHWLETGTNEAVKLSIGRLLEKGHPDHLDIYFLSWFIFQVITLIVLAFFPVNDLVQTVLIGLFSYRLLEILVSEFDSVFISVMQRKKHRSVPRLFSLVLVSYIEVILIFGIIFNFLLDHPSVLKSLYYSVSQATLAGATFEIQNNAIFTASIVEMLFGIFFVTGVIATIASYLGSKE